MLEELEQECTSGGITELGLGVLNWERQWDVPEWGESVSCGLEPR